MDSINLDASRGGINEVPFVNGAASSPQKDIQHEIQDSVEFSSAGLEITDGVSKVRSMNVSRQDRIGFFQSEVKGGNYPPPALIDGLINLIGSTAGDLNLAV